MLWFLIIFPITIAINWGSTSRASSPEPSFCTCRGCHFATRQQLQTPAASSKQTNIEDKHGIYNLGKTKINHPFGNPIYGDLGAGLLLFYQCYSRKHDGIKQNAGEVLSLYKPKNLGSYPPPFFGFQLFLTSFDKGWYLTLRDTQKKSSASLSHRWLN